MKKKYDTIELGKLHNTFLSVGLAVEIYNQDNAIAKAQKRELKPRFNNKAKF